MFICIFICISSLHGQLRGLSHSSGRAPSGVHRGALSCRA